MLMWIKHKERIKPKSRSPRHRHSHPWVNSTATNIGILANNGPLSDMASRGSRRHRKEAGSGGTSH